MNKSVFYISSILILFTILIIVGTMFSINNSNVNDSPDYDSREIEKKEDINKLDFSEYYKSEKLEVEIPISASFEQIGYKYVENNINGIDQIRLIDDINYILEIVRYPTKLTLDKWVADSDYQKHPEFWKLSKSKYNGLDAYILIHQITTQITSDIIIVKNAGYIYEISYLAPMIDGIDCENTNNPNGANYCTEDSYVQAKMEYKDNKEKEIQAILEGIKFL
jgi:hypothetical protein